MSAENEAPRKKRGLLVALVHRRLRARGRRRRRPARQHRRAEAAGQERLRQARRGDGERRRPGQWGTNWPREFDGYKRTSEPTHTKYGGGGEGPRGRAAREGGAGSVADADLRRVPVRRRLPRPPWPRLHAHRPGEHEAQRADGGQAVRQLPALSRLDHAALQKAREGRRPPGRRGRADPEGPFGGRRPRLPWDAHKELEQLTGRQGAPGLVRRLPRSRFDGGPHSTAAGLHHRHPEARRLHGRRGAPSQHRALAQGGARPPLRSERGRHPGRKSVRMSAPSATSSTSAARGRPSSSRGPKGSKVEEMERLYDGLQVKGQRFKDWTHAETGMEVLKAQHPEFEMWSQGIHARSGVSCADCHMSYRRDGSQKIAEHWVRSPLLSANRSCASCHPYNDEELKGPGRGHPGPALRPHVAGRPGVRRHARRHRGRAETVRRAEPPGRRREGPGVAREEPGVPEAREGGPGDEAGRRDEGQPAGDVAGGRGEGAGHQGSWASFSAPRNGASTTWRRRTPWASTRRRRWPGFWPSRSTCPRQAQVKAGEITRGRAAVPALSLASKDAGTNPR